METLGVLCVGRNCWDCKAAVAFGAELANGVWYCCLGGVLLGCAVRAAAQLL
jgi:hypothetical protein